MIPSSSYDRCQPSERESIPENLPQPTWNHADFLVLTLQSQHHRSLNAAQMGHNAPDGVVCRGNLGQ
jgi:hypothetical protein